ncbi:MAG TPA: maleylacetate reductase [Acidimicrobiia bacterium]|nr:maleylacetate reductase [Acidimicrobiia bacterium]
MNAFVYESQPGRVVFGLGAQARIAEEVDRLGAERVLLLSSPSATAAADALHAALGPVALRWTEVAEHVPVGLAERARAAAWDAHVDVIVTIGGGSAIGLAKAVALELGAPIVAVPTTYAGSEMTPMYGLTGDHKVTGRDSRVLPRVVVYDPDLTLGLPIDTSIASACNALAHCIEGCYGPGANPVTTLSAIEGIRVLSANVPLLARDARDVDVRSELLYGAYLAGTVIASVGVGVHHRTCHVLGGSYGLAHAASNAVILPHAIAYNAPAVPDLVARWRDAMGTSDPAGFAFDLVADAGLPTSLASLGLPEAALDDAAARIVEETPNNPRPVDVSSVRAMLDGAWRGVRPTSASPTAAR